MRTLWNYTTLKQCKTQFYERSCFITLWNYTTLKRIFWCIFYPPSFTTLWNHTTLKRADDFIKLRKVLLPYEITLLSNTIPVGCWEIFVLLPYEITLLSNKKYGGIDYDGFYYLMKLHYSQTVQCFRVYSVSFTTLWNYTTLKPLLWFFRYSSSFTTLWNYTTLKPDYRLYYWLVLFYYLMKLHYSQTLGAITDIELTFYYLMKLHYSQT